MESARYADCNENLTTFDEKLARMWQVVYDIQSYTNTYSKDCRHAGSRSQKLASIDGCLEEPTECGNSEDDQNRRALLKLLSLHGVELSDYPNTVYLKAPGAFNDMTSFPSSLNPMVSFVRWRYGAYSKPDHHEDGNSTIVKTIFSEQWLVSGVQCFGHKPLVERVRAFFPIQNDQGPTPDCIKS